MADNNEWDVLVVGGGPAGLTAAIVAAGDGLRTCVLETATIGGELQNVPALRDFPSVNNAPPGWELANDLMERLGAAEVHLELDTVESLTPDGDRWAARTRDGTFAAGAVIIATGSKPKHLTLERADELEGRGLSDCAVCDGPLFSGQAVAVVGCDDIALSEAGFLADHATDVTILAPERPRAALIGWRAEVLERANVSLVEGSEVLEVLGDELVRGLRYRDADGEHELEVGGVFMALGRVPATLPFDIATDDTGAIEVDSTLRASMPGLFAAGDVRSGAPFSAATAIGDGVLAARAASRYLQP